MAISLFRKVKFIFGIVFVVNDIKNLRDAKTFSIFYPRLEKWDNVCTLYVNV